MRRLKEKPIQLLVDMASPILLECAMYYCSSYFLVKIVTFYWQNFPTRVTRAQSWKPQEFTDFKISPHSLLLAVKTKWMPLEFGGNLLPAMLFLTRLVIWLVIWARLRFFPEEYGSPACLTSLTILETGAWALSL